MKSTVLVNLATAASFIFVSVPPSFANKSGVVSSASDCIRTRASFDVGSGQTKMKVFTVDVCKQTAKQIYPAKGNAQEDCESRSNLLFKKNLDDSIADAKEKAAAGKTVNWKNIPRFTQDFLEDGIEVPDPCTKGGKTTVSVKSEFKRLTDKAKSFNPDDIVGVATEAFRESTNSDYVVDYLARTNGMRLLIPSGSQEALIEWMSVAADYKSREDKADVNPNTIITLGIGSGSMQIGSKGKDGSFAAFPSTLASDNINLYAINSVKGSDQLLPMSAHEIDQIKQFASQEAGNASDKVKSRIGDSQKVVGVGGTINKSLQAVMLNTMKIKRDFFLQNDVERALAVLADKNADAPEFAGIDANYRQAVIPNLALIAGVMENLGIEKIEYSKVDNTLGALFTKEFGIQMKYVKPVVESEEVAAARENRKAKVVLTKQDTEIAAPAQAASGGGDDENEAICTSAPKHSKVGNVCTISEPCLNFTDLCSNKASLGSNWGGKTCELRGKTTIKYTMCAQ